MKYNEIMSITNLKGKFARSTEEEVERYKKVEVYVTEKIDGENWRLGILDGRKFIGGRKHLFYWDEVSQEFIHDFTHMPHPNWSKINEKTKEDIFRVLTEIKNAGYDNIIFYGELYGNGLQSRFKFSHEGYALIYYEISINGKYLDQKEAFSWFERYNIKRVPYVGDMTLKEFLNYDVETLQSSVAEDPYIEGIVAVPIGGEYKWDFADRFAVKKKIARFAETKGPKERGEKGPKYESPFSIHITEERLRHVLQDLEEDGQLLSHEKEFRFLVVEKMLENIQNEENEGIDFNKEDRKVLSSEIHRLFSEYTS